MQIPKSTVRLAQVVKMCGRPAPVTLWAGPKKDASFQAALRENRVLTLIQETVGTRKDFGVVGFHRDNTASYWVFPKALDAFEDKRVIGINYDLVKVEPPPDPVKVVKPPAKNPPRKPKAEPVKPELVPFQVTVRCIAT